MRILGIEKSVYVLGFFNISLNPSKFLIAIHLISDSPILCYPLLLLPSIFPSIKVFSNKSALCTRWPKYWSFGFSISPYSEYSGLISFRIDWFTGSLLEVQGLSRVFSSTIIWKHQLFGTQPSLGFPGGSDGKESACSVGDLSSIPGSGRAPGEGNGNPLQYSCLENPMDGGTWQATVHELEELDTTKCLHFSRWAFFMIQLTSIHNYWKNHSLDKMDLCWQSNVSAFEYAVKTFLPRTKRLLISWLQSPSAVFWSPQNKDSDCFHCFPIYLPRNDGNGCHDLSFLNVEL